MFEIKGKVNTAVCYAAVVEEEAIEQIRRMCEAAGLRVLRLRRTQEGTLRLGMLPSGKWRELTKEEIESLNGE